jgi:hypothetical protein
MCTRSVPICPRHLLLQGIDIRPGVPYGQSNPGIGECAICPRDAYRVELRRGNMDRLEISPTRDELRAVGKVRARLPLYRQLAAPPEGG